MTDLPPPTIPDVDRLQHQILGGLTVIQGRTFLLRRRLVRSEVRTDAEHARVLAELAELEAGVQQLVTVMREPLTEVEEM